jgi:hypothetical protein
LRCAGTGAADAGGEAQLSAGAREKKDSECIADGNGRISLAVEDLSGIEDSFAFLADIEKNPFRADLQDRRFDLFAESQLAAASETLFEELGETLLFVVLFVESFVVHINLWRKESSRQPSGLPLQIVSEQAAAVLVVMAVDAEIFPVAAVGGIVVVVAVFVVYGQQVQIVRLELAAALGADPAMQFQGAFPIVFVGSRCLLHLAHQFGCFLVGEGVGRLAGAASQMSGHLWLLFFASDAGGGDDAA